MYVRSFNDSVASNATKSYTVPAGKVWRLNYCASPYGVNITIGNPSVVIAQLYNNVNSDTNIFLVANTEIKLSSSSAQTVKYFFSVSEFNQ